VSTSDQPEALEGVAVIGMSGRFPGAQSLDEFWSNLRNGVESISHFSAEELKDVDPALVNNPNYVKAAGVLENIDLFDAQFFGFTPREAEIMDPQHRFFLECAWEALESAGYEPDTYKGLIGTYAGMGMSKYLLNNLLPHTALIESVSPLQLKILNDKDFLTSLLAYEMNLKGPSVTIQTACSTSLVAICLACQSLLNYQCDIAISGGVCIEIPHRAGYFHVEGVTSPDGHCHTFDARAQGTVQGNGAGVVVLKRLSEAIADGDTIHAVIKGSATNNDGATKVGFTATSVDGQMDVIALAQAVANVEPDTIGYIEAHGTATPLGDPIEVAALTQIFRESTARTNFCALGSVKTNIGHLDTAAGVAGVLKTVLALKHGQIPPSLNFSEPNPHIDFANSPFYVNDKLTEWKSNGTPRRAGVSSFSLGGVNAHVVLEEAPHAAAAEPSARASQLLVLSARTEAALEKATGNLVDFLKQHPEQNLADVAYTYQVGRKPFTHRRTLVCDSSSDALTALETRDPRRVLTSVAETQQRPVTFMFPGLGNQYVNMAHGLYVEEPGFREEVDRCCEILKPHLGLDLRDVLYPAGKEQLNAAPQKADSKGKPSSPGLDLRKMLRRDDQQDDATRKLDETWLSQPALFVIEYALAQWWIKCGIRPQALIGYSIGEHVAACLAGVLSLEDALWLVAKRAQLIQELPAGAMLAVPLSEKEVQPLVNQQLSLAAVNGPAVCVLAGPPEAIDELEERLMRRGVACRRPKTTHAFHSRMMTPIAEAFTALMKQVKLNAPEIPYISNVTGTWITAEQATDPSYWGRHLCQTVRFADGIQTLRKTPERILLELGPGNALGAWVMQHSDAETASSQHLVLSSLRHSYDIQLDGAFLLNTLAKFWLAGVEVEWSSLYIKERRRRIPLPTYPFERQRYWVEPQRTVNQLAAAAPLDENKKSDIADWFYLPSWKQTRLPKLWTAAAHGETEPKRNWLLFVDECGTGSRMAERLKSAGHEVVAVRAGEQFQRHDEWSFTLNPRQLGDYRSLFEELFMVGKVPHVIAHLWGVTREDESSIAVEFADECQYLGFYSLMFLVQVLGDQNFTDDLRLGVITNGVQAVTGDEQLFAEKATVIGPCKVIPREYTNITSQSIDITVPAPGSARAEKLIDLLISELTSDLSDSVVAYRGAQRWIQTFESARIEAIGESPTRLREEGVYLITGGAGGIGLVLAEYLARTVRAKLVLVGRSEATSVKIGKMQAIESLGAEVMYRRADVTDEEQMRNVVAETLARFGAIHGVVHAAGVLPGGLIQLKAPEAAAAVLAPKVKGTLVLERVLKDVQLDFIVLCSSLTATLGSFGMVDHCAANAFLDAFAQRTAATDGPRAISINWDTWLEVGQAAETPLAQTTALRSAATDVAHPLHDQLLSETADEDVYVTSFEATKHWVLNEHRMMGSGMIPGTAYLEMARAAFAKRAGGTIQIEQVLFMTPLVVSDGESNEVRTVIRKNGDGFEFVIQSEGLEHVRGKISDLGYEPARQFELEDILARCRKDELIFDRQGQQQQSEGETTDHNPHAQQMTFGPRWQRLLKRVHLGEREWVACLELPDEFRQDLEEYVLHPALMDASVGVVQLIGKGSHLPLGYEKLKVKGPLTQRVYSHVIPKEDSANGALLTCDVVIMDENGLGLVEIEGYTLKRLEEETIKALSEMSNSVTMQSAAPAPKPASTPKKKDLVQELKDGMVPAEGAEVFSRVLAANLLEPQVITSTKDIRVVMERVNTFTRAHVMQEVDQLQGHTIKHPRPNIQNPYVEPRNDLEGKLATLWQDMLGIDRVGCFDNFFELGGDSLLATKLIGRLGESFNVNLPLRTLFEAPTVADLAVVIVQTQAELTDTALLEQILSEIKDLPKSDVAA
jgi:phthiocerol/phenolphthiocerol synthesis type-I polyketide synthase E